MGAVTLLRLGQLLVAPSLLFLSSLSLLSQPEDLNVVRQVTPWYCHGGAAGTPLPSMQGVHGMHSSAPGPYTPPSVFPQAKPTPPASDPVPAPASGSVVAPADPQLIQELTEQVAKQVSAWELPPLNPFPSPWPQPSPRPSPGQPRAAAEGQQGREGTG